MIIWIRIRYYHSMEGLTTMAKAKGYFYIMPMMAPPLGKCDKIAFLTSNSWGNFALVRVQYVNLSASITVYSKRNAHLITNFNCSPHMGRGPKFTWSILSMELPFAQSAM